MFHSEILDVKIMIFKAKHFIYIQNNIQNIINLFW